MPGFRLRASHARAWRASAGAALIFAASASALAAQQSDSARRHSAPRDSVVLLAPLEVHASIAPAAGPTVGSGIPASISVIGHSDIEAWKPRLLTDVLTDQPGVSAYDDLGSPFRLTVGMRGFAAGPTVGTPAGVAVFVDGVRQNEPDAQEVNFDLLPMDFVQRIELLRGTASLLGPNGIGGAINLVTDRGSGPPHGEIEAGAGSFGTGTLAMSLAGRTNSSWDYFAGASGDREQGWRARSRASGARAFVNIGHTADERGMNVQGYAARSNTYTAGSLPESIFELDPRSNFTAGDLDKLELGQLSLSGYTPLAGGRGAVSVYARASHADRFNANQPPDDNVRGLTSAMTEGANADWRRVAMLGRQTLDVRVGVDASADQVRVRLFDLPVTGASTADSLTTDVSSPRVSVATYLLGDFHAGRVTLSLGARSDVIHTPFDDRLHPEDVGSGNTFRQLTPRGGVNVDIAPGARVYASVGSSFRAPALLELGCADPAAACPLPFALGDDPPLAPVHATTYETGGQWLLGSILLRGSLFRTDIRDEIFFVASGNALLSGYFTNLDRTRRSGGQISAQGMIDDKTSWNASYTRTNATFESPVQVFSIRSDDDFASSPLAGDNDVTAGDQLPLIPRDQAKAGVSMQLLPDLGVGIDGRYTGPQWLRGDEANQTRTLPAYTVLDARAGLAGGPWSIAVQVTNLLDSHAAIFGTFNENRQTGEIERFLTPLDARSIRLTVGRAFGRLPAGS